MAVAAHPRAKPAWVQIVTRYTQPDRRLAVGQLLNSLPPFGLLWYLAYRALAVHYALTLALAAVAAGLLVRIFIIQHDCGHGSFLATPRWNDWIGRFCSLFTLTPYQAWRHDHAVHHATSGNLDRRGTGDITTLTVDEYLSRPWPGRLAYRLFRHPVVLFGIGPVVQFVLLQRFAKPGAAWRERRSVWLTNAALVVVVGSLGAAVGWREFLLVQLPITALASSAGVWLFYVQHQFDAAYWARQGDWEYSSVALQGSSYYRLPRPFQWFTGNIGLHHVHHLGPRIPNYRLQACHDENPIFHTAQTMGFIESLRTIPLALWDEANQRLISFGDLTRQRVAAA